MPHAREDDVGDEPVRRTIRITRSVTCVGQTCMLRMHQQLFLMRASAAARGGIHSARLAAFAQADLHRQSRPQDPAHNRVASATPALLSVRWFMKITCGSRGCTVASWEHAKCVLLIGDGPSTTKNSYRHCTRPQKASHGGTAAISWPGRTAPGPWDAWCASAPPRRAPQLRARNPSWPASVGRSSRMGPDDAHSCHRHLSRLEHIEGPRSVHERLFLQWAGTTAMHLAAVPDGEMEHGDILIAAGDLRARADGIAPGHGRPAKGEGGGSHGTGERLRVRLTPGLRLLILRALPNCALVAER